LPNVSLEKIKPYIDKITGEYRNGLRDGRAVIENFETV